jgi:hypothetical protein
MCVSDVVSLLGFFPKLFKRNINMKNKSLSSFIAGGIVAVSCLVTVANAGIISDYSKLVADNDWNVVYQGGYGSSFDYAGVLGSIAPGSTVALASSSFSSSLTYDLFAFTSTTVLNTITSRNTTLFADDAYWYRNSSSLGFADTSSISQNSADTVCRSDSACGDLRISWHAGNNGDSVNGGWRSGLNTNLNSNNVWQRYVLVRNNNQVDVPEPSTLAIFALGIIGLASRRFKKQS